MNIDEQTKSDIETLLNVARPKLIEADKKGDSDLFISVSVKYGPIANRVYLALDKPERNPDHYHDKETKRVMLDPCTVINRSKSFVIQNFEFNIDDPEFWLHADMIKTLCDYLDLRFNKEDLNGSSQRASTI